MNISHPIGPNNITITSHPIRGLNGHRASGGIRQGPAEGENATWAIGNKNPKIRMANAITCGSIALMGP